MYLWGYVFDRISSFAFRKHTFIFCSSCFYYSRYMYSIALKVILLHKIYILPQSEWNLITIFISKHAVKVVIPNIPNCWEALERREEGVTILIQNQHLSLDVSPQVCKGVSTARSKSGYQWWNGWLFSQNLPFKPYKDEARGHRTSCWQLVIINL